MKKLISSRKQNISRFSAAAAHVLEPVRDFGEDFCAHILGGKVVSQEEEYSTFADVFTRRQNLAVQVKMCNCRHAHRPTVEQVEVLYNETGAPGFVTQVDVGVYALVFYGGVRGPKNGLPGKSMLLSRKLSLSDKRLIIAQELQYVYVVDIPMMHCLATHKDFTPYTLKSGKDKVWAQRKVTVSNPRFILHLTRTFLKKFMKEHRTGLHHMALDTAFGENGWNVVEKIIPVKFSSEIKREFKRTVPVRIIGSKATVRKILYKVGRKLESAMILNKELGLQI